MQTKRSFGIIGGDLRQHYLAKSLLHDNNNVSVFGFEKITKETDNFKKLSLPEVINRSEYIIFPVPITRNNQTINVPFSKNEIYIDNELINLLKNKKIFGGIIIPCIEKYVKKGEFSFFDYYDEDFIKENAALTAEGAIKVFLEHSSKSINKSKFLVLGYGRIGKVLCKILKNMGANVTASARNIKDKALIKQNGYHFINTNKITDDENLPSYDAIFNTVPAIILNEDVLKKVLPKTIIIDLASEPGGIDKKRAEDLNITFFHELGIPGRYFPESASEIIKKNIYKIIKEENI